MILVPASGRPIGGMKEAVLNNVDGIQYAICSNGAMLMDVPEEKSICETGIPTEKAVEAIAYLEQFPVAVYAIQTKVLSGQRGWEKTGLSEKYPYIRFSEGNVKDLGAIFKDQRSKSDENGCFCLKRWTGTGTSGKRKPYTGYRIFAHRRWDHRIKLCGCLKGKCTVYTL